MLDLWDAWFVKIFVTVFSLDGQVIGTNKFNTLCELFRKFSCHGYHGKSRFHRPYLNSEMWPSIVVFLNHKIISVAQSATIGFLVQSLWWISCIFASIWFSFIIFPVDCNLNEQIKQILRNRSGEDLSKPPISGTYLSQFDSFFFCFCFFVLFWFCFFISYIRLLSKLVTS